MASKKGSSVTSLFGNTIHYDEKGKKIGETRPNFFGGATHYDERGNKIGTSSPNFFGGETIYDNNNKKIGSSAPGFFSCSYYDANGRKVGSSTPVFGQSNNDCELSNRYENLYDIDSFNRHIPNAPSGSRTQSGNTPQYTSYGSDQSEEGIEWNWSTILGFLLVVAIGICVLSVFVKAIFGL